MSLLSKKYWDFINMDRYKFGPLALFPMIGFIFIGFSFSNIEILIADLKDLSIIENKIYDTRIDRNNLAIKLNDNKSEFFTDHTEIENDLKYGQNVKIYYKKRIFFPKHLIIFQLELNDKILIEFEMKKKEYLTNMVIYFISGFLFLGINYFYRKRVNK